MNKKTADFTDAELADYSKEHLLYEMQMLLGCARLMASTASGADTLAQWAFTNCRIEGYAIHLRNLVEFLYPRRCRDTDVTAAVFLHHGTALRPLSQRLHIARLRAHKEVAHLTTARRKASDPGRNWGFELVLEVFSVLDEFVQAAPLTKLHSEVLAFVRAVAAQMWAQSATTQRNTLTGKY